MAYSLPWSHPAWVCGLKLSMGSVWLASLVTPCVGVWIETLLSCQKGIPDYVTPCVGVWIETVLVDKWHIVYRGHTLRGCVDWNFPWVVFGLHLWSHPAWVCGLKLFCLVKREYQTMSHPAWVCGLKHDCTYSLLQISSSHPAWVCGLKLPPFSHLALRLCHTLRGCVDWNNAIPEYSNLWHVTPCVGVWIETVIVI